VEMQNEEEMAQSEFM